MKLVVPILFFALGIGLFARRLTPLVWASVIFFIALMIAYAYVKPI